MKLCSFQMTFISGFLVTQQQRITDTRREGCSGRDGAHMARCQFDAVIVVQHTFTGLGSYRSFEPFVRLNQMFFIVPCDDAGERRSFFPLVALVRVGQCIIDHPVNDFASALTHNC